MGILRREKVCDDCSEQLKCEWLVKCKVMVDGIKGLCQVSGDEFKVCFPSSVQLQGCGNRSGSMLDITRVEILPSEGNPLRKEQKLRVHAPK